MSGCGSRPRFSSSAFTLAVSQGSIPQETWSIRPVIAGPIRASVYALVSGAIADDDAARIADLHRALLLAVVVNDLPSPKVGILHAHQREE